MYIPPTSPTLPRSNTFVVLELDPVTTVSHLRSPELTAACKEIKTSKYVAYCLSRFEPTFDPDVQVPYHSYDLYLVHSGKGPLRRARYANPEWPIPILPNNIIVNVWSKLGSWSAATKERLLHFTPLGSRCTMYHHSPGRNAIRIRLSEEEAVEVDRWMESVPDIRKSTP